jgi:hypothetical protein
VSPRFPPPCIPCIPSALLGPARVHGQRAARGKGANFAMSLPCGCISTARTPVRRSHTQAGRGSGMHLSRPRKTGLAHTRHAPERGALA